MGTVARRERMLCPSTGAKFILAFWELRNDQEPAPGASCTPTVAPLFEKKRTPPEARAVNWLSRVEPIERLVESPQTKEPGLLALAR